jgi:hypothetical protein
MSPVNAPNRWQFILAGGALALAVAMALALALWQPNRRSEPPRVAEPVTPKMVKTAAVVAGDGGDGLRAACDALRQESNPVAMRHALAGLRQELSAMPPRAAVAAIRKFLDSKADASTHLGFRLASNGTLDEAPTLRTFLLDELARIDPSAAAEYSKTILAGMDSPDEWAVALRSLALGDSGSDGRALLEEKATAMLQYAPWQQDPSVGYLEAFDVAVYLGGTDLVPALSGLVQSEDNPAVAHAAFLALDRLVINDPAAVLASLESDPDLMDGRESTRADYFARADVRDPQQRQVLESYLLDPAIGAAELNTFAGIYPNANFMISPNLLTQNITLDHDALISRDAQSLAVAQQWLADPRFAPVAPELQTVVQRLEGFAAQARGQ